MAPSLETDLATIAGLAEPHWADNWNFRAFLQQEVTAQEVDTAVHLINREISGAIDCTACGNCCREIQPELEDSDIARLAAGMKITPAVLQQQLRRTPQETHVFCVQPCPLLKENKCSQYQHRPDDCRDYPHLHRDDFLSLSIGIIENYGTCPIIFNVYNQLKKHFTGYNPERDYIGDSDPEA